jgi:hypothetical protein
VGNGRAVSVCVYRPPDLVDLLTAPASEAHALLQRSVMATRAEQFRSAQMGQRDKSEDRASSNGRKKPKKSEWRSESKHAGVKATHALEETSSGARPSRKSTRASANRAKPDAHMQLGEERVEASPETRARRARVSRTRVRGK